MRYFLPVLFISYMASITFFAHMHVVNGVTIVHSHPFKKGAAHSHTSVEFLSIHLLSHLVTDGAATLFLVPFSIPFLLCLLLKRPLLTHHHAPYHGVVALRAPPVVRSF
ncbi:hypothetical protein [Bacteroides bouchesdurhonensis]|uniref:hypothetical protein n=1 Tax=Bacteroides bouchesdurhonensis TaxID=1841855 RepID=UPI00373FD790